MPIIPVIPQKASWEVVAEMVDAPLMDAGDLEKEKSMQYTNTIIYLSVVSPGDVLGYVTILS